MPNLMDLMDFILTFQASSAVCEQGFLAMVQVKTNWTAEPNTSALSNC